MNRRTFIGIAGGSLLAAGGGAYLLSDRHSVVRDDMSQTGGNDGILTADERDILYLASLAPSGHNTQPWFVRYIRPYHWIIGNDRSRWLPAVDPTQRETVLSIGAFIENLVLSAKALGYGCDLALIGSSNQDDQMVEIKLTKGLTEDAGQIARIKQRRTVRSGFLNRPLSQDDVTHLFRKAPEQFRYYAVGSPESSAINEQTVEANRLQAARDDAQSELAEWIRFSGADAEKHRDGLTTAGMEIEGVAGWFVRNFYDKADVMSESFRRTTVDRVAEQVSSSSGWILVTSRESSVADLLETGRLTQDLLLNVRERAIAIHPMTQILEEPEIARAFNGSIGLGEGEKVQFILRAGYLKSYPEPVSLRRPVGSFLKT